METTPTDLGPTLELRVAILNLDPKGVTKALKQGASPYQRVALNHDHGVGRSAYEDILENRLLLKALSKDVSGLNELPLNEAIQEVLKKPPQTAEDIQVVAEATLMREARQRRKKEFHHALLAFAEENNSVTRIAHHNEIFEEDRLLFVSLGLVLSSAGHKAVSDQPRSEHAKNYSGEAEFIFRAGKLGQKAAREVIQRAGTPNQDPGTAIRTFLQEPLPMALPAFHFQAPMAMPEPKGWLQRRRAWLEDKGLLPSDRRVKDNWAP